MNIDNKTKAAVLRELADELKEHGGEIVRQMIYERANKLDPPQKPIHPHEGCMGMIVSHIETGRKKAYTGILHADSDNYVIPREASKLPAFLCDGTMPEWVADDDMVIFLRDGYIDKEKNVVVIIANDWDLTDWHIMKNEYFCVINSIEVQ